MAGEHLQVLVVEVGGQRYGLPVADVRELVRAVTILPVPRAPAIVEGIINLRGNIVAVLDIRARFGLPAKPLEPADHFVVAEAGNRMVALRVDRALDLVHLEAADIEDARGLIPGADYVSWVAKLPHNLVLVHDLRTFLSRAESAALAETIPASMEEKGGQP